MVRDYIASLPAGSFPAMTGLADEFAFADPDTPDTADAGGVVTAFRGFSS